MLLIIIIIMKQSHEVFRLNFKSISFCFHLYNPDNGTDKRRTPILIKVCSLDSVGLKYSTYVLLAMTDDLKLRTQIKTNRFCPYLTHKAQTSIELKYAKQFARERASVCNWFADRYPRLQSMVSASTWGCSMMTAGSTTTPSPRICS